MLLELTFFTLSQHQTNKKTSALEHNEIYQVKHPWMMEPLCRENQQEMSWYLPSRLKKEWVKLSTIFLQKIVNRQAKETDDNTKSTPTASFT